MSLTERMDDFQRRHTWAGFPIAVTYKYIDDQGAYLAALITYYGFLSVFPLLLILASVLGFFLQGDPELQTRILDSALSQFPVIGQQLGDPQGLRGSATAVTIGVIGSLYGALGVAQAAQNAMNTAWSVPRNHRPNPLLARLRSLLLLATAGLVVLATTVVSALATNAAQFGLDLGQWLTLLVTLASIVLNTGIIMLAFRLATAIPLTLAQRAPGAIVAALIWQALQSFGASYVNGVIRNAGAVNGVFAIVLGLIAWIYLTAVTALVCVEINVVRSKQLYPRALLTPFTDNVNLTPADQRSYTESAAAQRLKGFEAVEVTFAHDGQNAAAQKARNGGSTGEPDDPPR